MRTLATDQTEPLVQLSRRQLWTMLVLLLLVGGAFLLDLVVNVHIAPVVSVMIPIAIVFMQPLKTKGLDLSKSNPALQALRSDELRQLAQAKAFRNGFFVLLAYPPLCAFALIGLGVANPLPILVESGAWLGAVTCLASLLWYDR
jgi:hypothetical protein